MDYMPEPEVWQTSLLTDNTGNAFIKLFNTWINIWNFTYRKTLRAFGLHEILKIGHNLSTAKYGAAVSDLTTGRAAYL